MGFVAQRGFVLSVTHPGCLEGAEVSLPVLPLVLLKCWWFLASVVMEQPSGSIWVPLGEPGLWFCGLHMQELFPSGSLCFCTTKPWDGGVGSHLLSFPEVLHASGFGNIPNLSCGSLPGGFRATWFSSEGEEWVLPAQSEV